MEGNFGLEKESLRLTPDGQMAHTPHPFTEKCIVTDFCENQIEINTDPHQSLKEVMNEMLMTTRYIQRELKSRNELLWPFSNPALILSEEDIDQATTRKNEADQKYRSYLAMRYGKYKMTFSGIHFNFSFSDQLLQAAFENSPEKDFRLFTDRLYLNLGKKAAEYGWLITALTSASPILDGSYYEKGLKNSTSFSGMASMRNSEFGYWNFFTPVFDYEDTDAYTRSIERYCKSRLIKAPSELYYPIRLKPPGTYTMENLKEKGIQRIELRMIDLNPFEESGLSYYDLQFFHLLLVWLACLPDDPLTDEMQILAAQNFKNAAHFDLKTARISKLRDGEEISIPAFDEALSILNRLENFASEFAPDYFESILIQKKKLLEPLEFRYSWKMRRLFHKNYVREGLKLASERQDFALELETEQDLQTFISDSV